MLQLRRINFRPQQRFLLSVCIAFRKSFSYAVVLTVYARELLPSRQVADELVFLILLRLAVHVGRNSLLEDLVGGFDFVIELLPRELMHRFLILALCLHVLDWRKILPWALVNDALNPFQVLFVLFGLLHDFELVVGN